MNGLFGLLFDALPVGPSQDLPTGERSRGWTLRPDRMHPTAMRFDWIHGRSNENTYAGNPAEREALREDVLAAAAKVATQAGFRVKVDGIGLLMVAPKRTARVN